jgi:mono/diheme cytochrome c family protein
MKKSRLLAQAASLAFSALVPAMASADDFSSELIARGNYLATASDCIACHTASGGRPMAGEQSRSYLKALALLRCAKAQKRQPIEGNIGRTNSKIS